MQEQKQGEGVGDAERSQRYVGFVPFDESEDADGEIEESVGYCPDGNESAGRGACGVGVDVAQEQHEEEERAEEGKVADALQETTPLRLDERDDAANDVRDAPQSDEVASNDETNRCLRVYRSPLAEKYYRRHKEQSRQHAAKARAHLSSVVIVVIGIHSSQTQ